jgi:hypothetical protein
LIASKSEYASFIFITPTSIISLEPKRNQLSGHTATGKSIEIVSRKNIASLVGSKGRVSYENRHNGTEVTFVGLTSGITGVGRVN